MSPPSKEVRVTPKGKAMLAAAHAQIVLRGAAHHYDGHIEHTAETVDYDPLYLAAKAYVEKIDTLRSFP